MTTVGTTPTTDRDTTVATDGATETLQNAFDRLSKMYREKRDESEFAFRQPGADTFKLAIRLGEDADALMIGVRAIQERLGLRTVK